jgi:hypothetical protein
VGHHPQRHIHLRFADRLLGGVGNQGEERAEGQRVQHEVNVAGWIVRQFFLDLIEHARPLAGIGGVRVEEDRLAPQCLDVGHDLPGARQRRSQVKVHPEDVHPCAGQRACRCCAEPTRRSQDECPLAFKFVLAHCRLLCT